MDIKDIKKAAAVKAVEFIKDSFIVGLGTGSTAFFAIQEIAARINNNTLQIFGAVPTSLHTEELAKQFNIPLLNSFERIDITIDGADEVDPAGNLIKGGGGALTREKIVAAASEDLVIVVDQSKLVNKLGAFPLPVEVLPFGLQTTYNKLASFGCKVNVRKNNDELFQTDNGNYILDCKFVEIENPEKLFMELNKVPGVIDNGLFINLAKTVVSADQSGEIKIIKF